VGGLAVIVLGTLFLVWSNLDGLVKGAIQSFGSEATRTRVTVSNVKLSLETGEARISGLNVSNPDGFSDPNIIELGMISTKIDTTTLNQNLIVIDEIIISAPSVIYEINKSGTSNVDMLKNNLSQSAGATDSGGGGDELKMIILKLLVEGGKAKVRIAELGDAQQTINLPKVQLTDVGKKSGGVTAAEVAQIISSKLLGNVKSSVANLGVGKYLGKPARMFKKDAMDTAGEAATVEAKKEGGTVKRVFGN
jgi:hypothetical protein